MYEESAFCMNTNFTNVKESKVHLFYCVFWIAAQLVVHLCVGRGQESSLVVVPLMSFIFWSWGLPLGQRAYWLGFLGPARKSQGFACLHPASRGWAYKQMSLQLASFVAETGSLSHHFEVGLKLTEICLLYAQVLGFRVCVKHIPVLAGF